MISEYFDRVKKQIKKFEHITEDASFEEKSYSNERGYISGEVSFIDMSKLDFAEVKDMEIKEKLKYNYHYMNSSNELIFRYDNAKHHKNIETFPHHKHLPNEITTSTEPDVTKVLSEIEEIVLKNK